MDENFDGLCSSNYLTQFGNSNEIYMLDKALSVTLKTWFLYFWVFTIGGTDENIQVRLSTVHFMFAPLRVSYSKAEIFNSSENSENWILILYSCLTSYWFCLIRIKCKLESTLDGFASHVNSKKLHHLSLKNAVLQRYGISLYVWNHISKTKAQIKKVTSKTRFYKLPAEETS